MRSPNLSVHFGNWSWENDYVFVELPTLISKIRFEKQSILLIPLNAEKRKRNFKTKS